MTIKRVLTGVKPTGTPHLGNWVGGIRPALELASRPGTEALLFIADAHALTTLPSPEDVQKSVYEVAATWLALGLDPARVLFYRQSRIPEDFELFWILTCVTPKGLMNRAHAYKALAAETMEKTPEDPDRQILMGVYNYPILMAADILLFQAHQVPVGKDQLQHLEIARDLAGKFNQAYGETFVFPDPLIPTQAEPLVGLDGRKMSKSYGNTIPLFAPSEVLRALVFKIQTNSLPPEAPKDPDTCALFGIYRHFVEEAEIQAMRARYAAGIGWGEMKTVLFQTLEAVLAPKRALYQELIEDKKRLDKLLENGEDKARAIARETLKTVRTKVGLWA